LSPTPMNKQLLVSLGFSEESAKVVSDFLGERVITPEKKRYNNPKPTPEIPTNGET
jgi:hypothetical protein